MSRMNRTFARGRISLLATSMFATSVMVGGGLVGSVILAPGVAVAGTCSPDAAGRGPMRLRPTPLANPTERCGGGFAGHQLFHNRQPGGDAGQCDERQRGRSPGRRLHRLERRRRPELHRRHLGPELRRDRQRQQHRLLQRHRHLPRDLRRRQCRHRHRQQHQLRGRAGDRAPRTASAPSPATAPSPSTRANTVTGNTGDGILTNSGVVRQREHHHRPPGVDRNANNFWASASTCNGTANPTNVNGDRPTATSPAASSCGLNGIDHPYRRQRHERALGLAHPGDRQRDRPVRRWHPRPQERRERHQHRHGRRRRRDHRGLQHRNRRHRSR